MEDATRDEEMPPKSPGNPSKRRRIDIGAESAEIQGVTGTTETQEHAVGEDGSFQPDSSAESFKMPDPSHYAASPPTDEYVSGASQTCFHAFPILGGKGVCFHCASSDRLCFPNSSSGLLTRLNAMQQLIVDLSEECRRLRKTNHDLESSHRNLELKMDAEISRLDGEIDDLRDSASESGDTVSSSKAWDPGPEIELRDWSMGLHPSQPGIMQCRTIESLDITFPFFKEDPKAQDLGALMEVYDSFARLSVSDCFHRQALHFRPTPQFEVITNLRLEGVIDIDALSIFSLLPCLSCAEFYEVDFTKTTAAPRSTCSPLLQTLLVFNCRKESWLSRLSCPSLTTFLHYVGNFPLSFFRSHRTVTALFLSNNKYHPGILHKIESTHPDIKWLCLDDVESFINQDMGSMKTPPFPRLEHLDIRADVNLEQFEAIVKTRCLPVNHSQSQLSASITPLKTLCMGEEFARCKFASSPFFKSAAQQIVTDPYWPDTPMLRLSWL